MLFGNDNAESDDYLFHCIVREPIERFNRPILVGRWGTGKTATFLVQNRDLSDALMAAGSEPRAWYRNEQSLDITALSEILASESRPPVVVRVLEHVWLSEILRIHCELLATLHSTYHVAPEKAEHWKRVVQVGGLSKQRGAAFLWRNVGRFLAAIVGGSDRAASVTEIERDLIDHIVSPKLLQDVRQCLLDIRLKNPKIAVVVEPIDTPRSDLEKSGSSIADYLIAALQNAWRDYFEPSASNPFNVRMAIPWHRQVSSTRLVNQPQKLAQYVRSTVWRKTDLKRFVTSRIEHGFREIGRQETYRPGRDAWDIMFPKMISHRRYDVPLDEPVFDYILRHTHHRPRDLQALLREIVQEQATENRAPSEQAYLRSNDVQVKVDCLRSTLSSVGRRRATLLLQEAERRTPGIIALVTKLGGARLPFSTDYFTRRAGKSTLREDVRVLWESGVLGVTAYSRTRSVLESIEQQFTSMGSRKFAPPGSPEPRVRWTWFEYNHLDGDPWDIMSRLHRIFGESERSASSRSLPYGLVVHPILFEYLGCILPWDQCPIGS